MSEQTPPYPYYNGIIYNSKLFSSATGDYLPRSGVATSVATSTTFNGTVYTSGLSNTGTLSTTNLSVSGTVSLPSASIADTALSTNVALKNGTQTFSGTNTFSVAPVMSGASITATTIPDTALSTNQATLSGTQTFSGAKTFSVAPVMSVDNIYGIIPDGSLSTNVALLPTTQTFTGAKTFSVAPVMSGASITATSIPDTALSSNQATLSGTQTFSGAKTYSAIINANGGITRATAQTTATANDYLTKSYQQTNNYCNDFNGLVLLNKQFPILFGYNSGTLGSPFYSQLDCDNVNLSYNPSTGITNCFASSAIDIAGDTTYSLGAIPYKKTALTTSFTALGTAGQYLVSQGTSAPTWNTLSVPDSALTSNVALLNGSQTFTGIPKAPTAVVGTNTTQIATTAFVLANSSSSLLSSNNSWTGTNNFSVAPVMSGASITATSIPDSALSTNVALKNGTQTFSGTNTFSVAPVMSGASITATTIPDTALSTNQATLSGTQTFSGAKTFSSAPTMSGSNITGTIPDGSLSSNQATLSGTQIFSGAKTFSSAPTMSGSNITGTIPDGSLSTNVALLPTTQTFTGAKTFSSLLTASNLITTSQTLLSYSANTTLTAPFYQTYMLNPSGSALTTDITLTIGTSAIPDGTVINFRKYANTTANILLVMTGRSFVPYNSTSGIGTVLLTANQQATSIVINGANAYQTYIGGSEITDIITNNETVNNNFTVGLYNPSQYFSGSYTYSTNYNALSNLSTTNFTYLLVTTSNTIVYTGTRALTLNYVVIGGGGNGGNGGVNTGGGGGSGGGGGAGQYLSGTTTVSTGQSIVLVVGSAGTASSLTIGGSLIANAVGGNNGVSVGAGTSGAAGGAGAGGTPAGGGGGVGAGGAGSANSTGASGGGGDGGGDVSSTNTGGVFQSLMADGTLTNSICYGGNGGLFNASAPAVIYSYGSGGNGGGGRITGGGLGGSSGIRGVILLYFNTNIFQATTNGIFTQLPITPIYTILPTFTSSQIGYSVPISVNTSGSNVASQYYLLATITNMPIGVFIIFYTLYIGGGGAGFQIGLSTSSTTATNSYLNYTDLVAIGMSSYYYVFNNTSVRTIYIMGYSSVSLNFQTNYGSNSASCVRIA